MKDSWYTELAEIQQTLRGISPKLSLYAKLKQREKELLELTGGQRTDPFERKK